MYTLPHIRTHAHVHKLNDYVAQLVVKTPRRKTKNAGKRNRFCFFVIFLNIFMFIYSYVQMYMNEYS